MDLKLFQKDVADMIGVSECTVYNWENRGIEPGIKHRKIVGLFGKFRVFPIVTCRLWRLIFGIVGARISSCYTYQVDV